MIYSLQKSFTYLFTIIALSSTIQFSPMMIGPGTANIVHFGCTTVPSDIVILPLKSASL